VGNNGRSKFSDEAIQTDVMRGTTKAAGGHLCFRVIRIA
jgi:hypothetical protein